MSRTSYHYVETLAGKEFKSKDGIIYVNHIDDIQKKMSDDQIIVVEECYDYGDGSSTDTYVISKTKHQVVVDNELSRLYFNKKCNQMNMGK